MSTQKRRYELKARAEAQQATGTYDWRGLPGTEYAGQQGTETSWRPVRGRTTGAPVGDSQLREMLEVLALDNLLEAEAGPPAELVELAARRAEARAAKDFGEADRLRDEVRAAGWEIRDGPAGPELVPTP